jgi:hypothetical protein
MVREETYLDALSDVLTERGRGDSAAWPHLTVAAPDPLCKVSEELEYVAYLAQGFVHPVCGSLAFGGIQSEQLSRMFDPNPQARPCNPRQGR